MPTLAWSMPVTVEGPRSDLWLRGRRYPGCYRQGRRNLHTGEVIGDDPLDPLCAGHRSCGAASIEKRAWRVRRVMDFPHAGDLMVISTVHPDGTVAALEELIGNHGGIGGEQTG